MAGNAADLNSAVKYLSKKRHSNPAIILSVSGETASIGPIDQRWEIGSITKVFTSLLLARLVIENQISLLDNVASYLPDGLRLPINFEKITFENLASHQSGLPRLPAGMKLLGKGAMNDPYAIFDEERILKGIEETKLRSTPGLGPPRYSNYGFGLLGFTLEKATGIKYEKLLIQKILNPLRLDSSTFGDDELRQGHSGKKQVGPWHMGRFAGMGGLRMSARDLSRFLKISQDKSHDLAPAFAETFRVRHAGKKLSMGLAWHYLYGQNIVGHGGGTLGAMTEGYIDLETGNHVVLFGDGNPGTFKASMSLLGR